MPMFDSKIKARLDEANMLIFVRQYKQAAMILDSILSERDQAQSLLIHLRRIEVGTRLGELSTLHNRYTEQMHRSSPDLATSRLCVAMVEQQGQMVSTARSMQDYTEIMYQHGECAAAYFGIALCLEAEGNLDRALFNYQQVLVQDPEWYPAYFYMSQIFYKKNDHTQGDHYFFLFEKAAPYNLYGNIETHSKLAKKFLDDRQYRNAEFAIKTLSEWWTENRGQCPREISVLESLFLARIASTRGDMRIASAHQEKAENLVNQILVDKKPRKDDILFLSQVLHDFGENDLALKTYTKLLAYVDEDASLIQKVGTYFFAMNAFQHAEKLFADVYKAHPDDEDVRFCLLTSRLKLAGVDSERYLRDREHLAQSMGTQGDINPRLAKALSLLKEYADDPDMQAITGELYLLQGNIDRASEHFQRMYTLDKASTETSFRYASFLVHYGNSDKAKKILDTLGENIQDEDKLLQIHALKTHFFEQRRDFENALIFAKLCLDKEPWNAIYLCQAIRCHLHLIDRDQYLEERVTSSLEFSEIKTKDWKAFDKKTESLMSSHHYQVVYLRQQLRLLTSSASSQIYTHYIRAASHFNPSRAAQDLVKLLNTNFDSPWLYWALGVLFKEAGSLEIAEMWFEQVIGKASLPQLLRLRISIDLSDSYVWRGINLQKAIAYLKVVRESESEQAESAKLIMAHALLKLGEVRAARTCLEDLKETAHPSLEASYLQGLLLYRDGSIQKAKTVWKPLLTAKALNIKDHWIKKEIMDFYFQGKSYIPSAQS